MAEYSIQDLLDIMRRLRDPQNGCPWDIKQDFRSIAAYTLEESYEVVDAVETGDLRELPDELGDLLLQVVFHAQMGDEQDLFNFDTVIERICDKMIRRHPHVFADVQHADEQALHAAWEGQKHRERADKSDSRITSLMEGVALALPALVRAEKLQRRAARAGFDWHDTAPVLDKIREELDECGEAISGGGDKAVLRQEVGDLLFSCVNLARHLGVDAEQALRGCNRKFESRFRFVEQGLHERGLEAAAENNGLMESLWQAAKSEERHTSEQD